MRLARPVTPFTASDDEIEAALRDVSVPTLMLACAHMSGDLSVLDGPHRPTGMLINQLQGFMSEEQQSAARVWALDVIRDYRDRGCPPPADFGFDDLQAMMSWLACEPVGASDAAALLHDMGIVDDEPEESAVSQEAGERRRDFPVVVIGCGQSGLAAAVRLAAIGVDFTVIEKNAGIGGTWYENTYPGARVDSPNHLYSYSFEDFGEWSEYFSRQPELQRYFEGIATRHGVVDRIRFSTEVTTARWCADEAVWTVVIRDEHGVESEIRARAIISAVGQLNRPSIPSFEGMNDFAGSAFHSARWDHSVDLEGKRVAMIGAGATGFQIAPEIAPKVASLHVFQRTAQWMFPNEIYHAEVRDGEKWAMRHLPYYANWYRFMLSWPMCDSGYRTATVDPDYPDQDVAISELNEFSRQFFLSWFEAQLDGADDDLRAKVIPDYPACGKRTLQDNGSWLRTLRRDNVDLVREPIERITPNGIRTVDSKEYPVDVIIYATGFKTNDMLFPMAIVGKDGVDLRERWGIRPTAYLGITVPDFPNFFCIYGPGTNLATGGSVIFHSECQVNYAAQAIAYLADNDIASIEPDRARHDDWVERHQSQMRTMVWSQPAVKHSFYKNADGDVYTLSPWRIYDYWNMTRNFVPSDYVVDEQTAVRSQLSGAVGSQRRNQS
jgi:4-hydroxyacetophenone monooxygenase